MYIYRHCVYKRACILFCSYDHVHIEKEKKIEKIYICFYYVIFETNFLKNENRFQKTGIPFFSLKY